MRMEQELLLQQATVMHMQILDGLLMSKIYILVLSVVALQLDWCYRQILLTIAVRIEFNHRYIRTQEQIRQ